MTTAKLDPEILAHLEWIGFVRPTGLVVSAPALVRAGAILERRDIEGQQALKACIEERILDPQEGPVGCLPDFAGFARSVLGWSFSSRNYAGGAETPIPAELQVVLPDYGETLRPDFAVREPEPKEGAPAWQLVVRVLSLGEDFDRITREGGQLEASPQGRLERLLRQTGVPAGLLFNGQAVRLVSAPRGESSGWLDFRVADMLQPAGRPICTALRLILRERRLLALPRAQRLPALLEDSRKFQNEVSERLAEQVLHALYELVRGFQAAHDASNGVLLHETLSQHPDEVYRALLTVLLRLVFLLYAEERDMLPEDETFLRYYSLASLYERLREDAALYPDTMDQRYGAWAQLLVLFRMIHDGAEAGPMRLPRRRGGLFDPDRYSFLEGRTGGDRGEDERIEPPLVPDGTLYRTLDKLVVLDGERISYRALDVEQIGSVYETMMGFRLETATGRSIAVKAKDRHGAPTTVDLEALLQEAGARREKWFVDQTKRKLSEGVKKAVAAAKTLEDVHAALQPICDLAATPDLVPQGSMVLQPSEERRRSGSHYTPRVLTEPIVRTTLEPILARLKAADGQPPRPEQILDLKVCDPSMGSGAFLVEACRQLAEALVASWRYYGKTPAIPADEDELIFARRLIAQRCLYGVDRNPVAVDLAKMSLWLATLAREHPLTFLDHALRHGDSLVGLSRKQIEAFHWDAIAQRFSSQFSRIIEERVKSVNELRRQIREADEQTPDSALRVLWGRAQNELGTIRLYGDLVIAAFFSSEKSKERERRRSEYAAAVIGGTAEAYRGRIDEYRHAEQPVAPFHWEIEFPEVFERQPPGFDAFVGNPPFLGGTRISSELGMSYFRFLSSSYPPAEHLCDLAAYFFRRCFALLRVGGTQGLVATNTIAQGDTRKGGLAAICMTGGFIYNATKGLHWPGSAAVMVNVVHISKSIIIPGVTLNGRAVGRISAFLFHAGGDDDPHRLAGRNVMFSLGSKIYGQGFLFDDGDAEASPFSEMYRVMDVEPQSTSRILPYLGGSEVNDNPAHEAHRYVIYLSDLATEDQLQGWPELARIVRERVKPYRDSLGNNPNNVPLKRRWWAYQAHRPELYTAMSERERVLVSSQVSKYVTFAFVPTNLILSHRLNVFLFSDYAGFALLQSRAHEVWALFFGSTLEDRPLYTPSTCFETYPFPIRWERHASLEAAGEAYYAFRAALMLQNDEGLTKTYNRFHDPDECNPDIFKLRDLHAAMDRAVLDAYGWNDIPIECYFLLDYDIDEEGWGDKKKPYRYRWPDEVRDEVLARLLELNAKRAAEEARSGEAAAKKAGGKAATKRPRKTTKPSTPGQQELFQ